MYGEGKTRGKCSELKIPATINQACAAVVFSAEHRDRRPWVKLVLQATYERNRKMASGGVQPNLNLGLVRSIEIPLPSSEEQNSILTEIDHQIEISNRLGDALRRSSARAGTLRRSLLAEAFAGRLVEQNPADEPGSVLLERIREERVAHGLARRRRQDKRVPKSQEEALF
jgi:type I restriction enzyme S subunit